MKRIFKNGHIIDPVHRQDDFLDIFTRDGIIIQVGKRLEESEADVVDLNGLIVVPGLIDMHVHLREPGREDKETIETGTMAAIHGGITAVAAMPNTTPPADDISVIQYITSSARKYGWAKVFPIGAISKGRKGNELSEMGKLMEAGACGFSDDGQSVASAELLRHAFEYASMLNCSIMEHCEDPALGADGVMHEGYYSTMLGLCGIPSASEELIVMRDIALAELTDGRLHIAHVSTKKSVELIRAAKKRGVKVTAEVAPHHLLLSHETLITYNTNLKVNPPLRAKEDIDALLEGVIDGTIDVIASDHAPHTREEKEVEFDAAPFGISGVETTVQLILSEFVNKKLLTIKQLITAMSTKPSAILRIPGGAITEGNPCDLTVIDLKNHWTIDKEKFYSKGKNTPFHGKKGVGAPVMTIVNGEVLMKNKELVISESYEKFQPPQNSNRGTKLMTLHNASY